ncbi:VOC family protein [bacterium]|nr:VOC family protein [bacterium]
MATKHSELCIVILAVSDLKRASIFYETAFTLEKVVDTPVYIEYNLPNQIRIGLYDRTGFSRNTGKTAQQSESETTSATELYFYCENLENSIQNILDAGAEVLSPLQPRDWGDRAAYFSDPDGNVLVLAEKI